jgi:hypothetical protein
MFAASVKKVFASPGNAQRSAGFAPSFETNAKAWQNLLRCR